jgi:ferric-dicitrate binding protein FerR (iron transport regulator)
VKRKPNHKQTDLEAVLGGAPETEREKLQAFWDLAGTIPEAIIADPDASARVQRKLEALTQETSGPAWAAPPLARPPFRQMVPITRRQHPAWMAVAATIALAALAILWWAQPITQQAPLGEQLALTLPDGSNVTLNSGATLRYSRKFGDSRDVDLDGEAFFDVVPHDHPFIVKTFNAQVQVLGTQFNIKCWSKSLAPITTVTLESGRVALSALADPDAQVELEPGQTRSISAQTPVVSPIDTARIHFATAWRSGDLIFKDEILGTILEEVERRFAINVQLQNQRLQTKRVNISLRSPADAESVLENVCNPLGLKYRATSTGYALYDPSLQ